MGQTESAEAAVNAKVETEAAAATTNDSNPTSLESILAGWFSLSFFHLLCPSLV